MLNVAAQIPPPSPTIRSQGDTWGLHRRELAALPEAYSILPDGASHADTLIKQALALPFGFAGFNAPACLTLAETIQVTGTDADLVEQALDAAKQSAHNIQDPVFSARTTARCNAMRERWWAGSHDILSATDRLRQNPAAPEFAAVHIVGESYAHRVPLTTLPLPDWVREANTLSALANIYQRPVGDVLRLNTEHARDADQPLSPNTRVNIPDPGFPPLLAARFAAQALADQSLSSTERKGAIRTLVSVAVDNPTALDVVLARLLTAERVHDSSMLDALSDLTKSYAQVAAAAEQGLADSAMGFPA